MTAEPGRARPRPLDETLGRFLENLPVGIFVIAPDGEPQYVNPAAVEMLGRGIVDVGEGQTLSEAYEAFVAGTDDPYPPERLPISRALSGESVCVDDIESRRPDGSRIWLQAWGTPVLDAEGSIDYAVTAFIDVTKSKRAEIELSESERRAHESALRDELTGLCNRRGLTYAAEILMKMADRSQRALALLYIDVDNMKEINDQLGHLHGDRALVEFARVLGSTFRDSDVVARIGGDEFCVLLTTGSPDEQAVPAARLQEVLDRRNADPTAEYRLAVSIGVAKIEPDQDKSLEDLMAEADAAMYVEKARNRKRNRTLHLDEANETDSHSSPR